MNFVSSCRRGQSVRGRLGAGRLLAPLFRRADPWGSGRADERVRSPGQWGPARDARDLSPRIPTPQREHAPQARPPARSGALLRGAGSACEAPSANAGGPLPQRAAWQASRLAPSRGTRGGQWGAQPCPRCFLAASYWLRKRDTSSRLPHPREVALAFCELFCKNRLIRFFKPRHSRR